MIIACTTKHCAGPLVTLIQSMQSRRTVHRCITCNALYDRNGHELAGQALDARPAESKARDFKGGKGR